MTSNKLSGVYFNEDVTTYTVVNEDINDAPLIIIRGASNKSITGADDKYLEINGFGTLKTLASSAQIPNTLSIIENMVRECELGKFYVYNLKTNTQAGVKNAVSNSGHLDDCKTIIFIEEGTSSGATSTQIMNGLIEGISESLSKGNIRQAYFIPYGTVKSAIHAEGVTDVAATAVTTLKAITNGISNGHVCVLDPQLMAGQMMGGIIASEYDEEVAKHVIANVDTTGEPGYDEAQMLELENAGIMFVRPRVRYGDKEYHINYGVTTSFQQDKADGVLIRRRIVNEFLANIKEETYDIIYEKEGEMTPKIVETILASIINEYVNEKNIIRKGTKLGVVDAGNDVYQVTGTIQPVGSIHTIEVGLTITQ